MPNCPSQLAVRFAVRDGRWADYRALARHHYRSRRPATVWRVWRVEARASGPDGGGLLWRTGGYPTLAAVCVVSLPPLCSLARDAATGGRYAAPSDRRAGIARLNREVRTISRVIVHPLYRGLGLATRLVRRVLAETDAPLIEAFARMGRYVPFFERAGMDALRLPGRPVYYWRWSGRSRPSPPAGSTPTV